MVLNQKGCAKRKNVKQQSFNESTNNRTTELCRKLKQLNKIYESKGLSQMSMCEAAEAELNVKLIYRKHVTNGVISNLICMAVLLCNFLYIFWLTSSPSAKCLLPAANALKHIVRPISSCDYCKGLTHPKIFENLSQEAFRPYAYKQYPMIIKGAVSNWPAKEVFNFHFFRHLYNYFLHAHSYNYYEDCHYFPYESEIPTLQDFFTMNDSRVSNKKGEKAWYIGCIEDAYRSVDEECQFLHFRSNFISLRDVFAMSQARINNEPGQTPWYVGWGNCDPEVLEVMRRYYPVPHFLPDDYETPAKEYVFMGYDAGATMHLDFINRLMWQAQLKGTKTWYLKPSPECENVCNSLSFLVEPGDAVLIDTRVWYHGTTITPGEFSLAIQSEYG